MSALSGSLRYGTSGAVPLSSCTDPASLASLMTLASGHSLVLAIRRGRDVPCVAWSRTNSRASNAKFLRRRGAAGPPESGDSRSGREVPEGIDWERAEFLAEGQGLLAGVENVAGDET